ncbi:putative hydro-lyase [Solibacillus sp. FSL H8-0538]|uniref:putative hydro-lyase n=1 Tax=Solibacillus sp. FSL H8-0538 TaxID=2921400 RepID=UPI0030F95466
MNYENMSPKELRQAIRDEIIQSPTAGMSKGHTQANLAILPKEDAFDFLLFCQRNQKPCPLVDVLEPGQFESSIAQGSDIRTDIPKYRIYKNGEFIEEVNDITAYWQDDFVSFLIGCSFTFETPLLENGIPIRHIEEGCNVPMYKTSIETTPAGKFSGPLVVSMRPMTAEDAIRAVQITSRYPGVHGAPVHIGDPALIGIQDVHKPDFGDAVTIKDGEVPVFWACGVTPQAVAMQSKPAIMITHAPGHMFVSDQKDIQLSVL